MREEVGLIMDGFTIVAVDDTGWTKSASFGDRGKASAWEGENGLGRVVLNISASEEYEDRDLETVNSQCGASRVAHRA